VRVIVTYHVHYDINSSSALIICSLDWDPVQGFTFDIVCVVGLSPNITHARARISLHDGPDLVSPIYTTDATEAFYSGGMGGRTAHLGLAGQETRSFTHVIPSQGLSLVIELEVTKQDHGMLTH
jgi:hypothetical protein